MPKTAELVVVRDGAEERVELPLERHCVLLTMLNFRPPRFFTGSLAAGAIELDGTVTIRFGRDPEEVMRDLGVEKIKATQLYDPVSFARMIAKIAYSYAVAECGVGALDEVFVLPDILGERDKIGRWVGTHPERSLEPAPGLLHRLELAEHHDFGVLLGEVRLWADSWSPTYLVVLGRLATGAEAGRAARGD